MLSVRENVDASSKSMRVVTGEASSQLSAAVEWSPQQGVKSCQQLLPRGEPSERVKVFQRTLERQLLMNDSC